MCVHVAIVHVGGDTEPELVLCSAPSVSQSVFTITEKASTRAFSWLKVLSHLRHYAKQMLTQR